MSKDACLAALRGIFRDDGNCFQSASVLYDLAAEAQSGSIVEVGTADGLGAISMAFASRDHAGLPVYSIDPLVLTHGWIGEEYSPELREQWYRNILRAGVAQDVILVGVPVQWFHVWPEHASFTFWDTGLQMDICGEWLEQWIDVGMESGDVIGINETWQNNLGVDDWLATHDVLRLREIRREMVRVCVKR